jgi:hypothetical protein
MSNTFIYVPDPNNKNYLTIISTYTNTTIPCTSSEDCWLVLPSTGRYTCSGTSTRFRQWLNSTCCSCDFYWGHEGENCLHYGNAIGITHIVLGLLTILTATITGIIALRALWQVYRFEIYSSLRDTAITLVLGTIACISFFLRGSQVIDNVAFRQGNENVGIRAAFLFLVFFFFSTCLLHVSLVWIDSTQKILRLSDGIKTSIQRYRIVLIFYYGVFGITSCTFFSLNRTTEAEIVVIPSIVFMIISYGIASWQIRKLFIETITEGGGGGGGGANNVNAAVVAGSGTNTPGTNSEGRMERIRKMTITISRTALQVSLLLAAVLSSLAADLICAQLGMNRPGDGANILVTLAFLFAVLSILVVVWYSIGLVNTKVKRVKQTLKANNINNDRISKQVAKSGAGGAAADIVVVVAVGE